MLILLLVSISLRFLHHLPSACILLLSRTYFHSCLVSFPPAPALLFFTFLWCSSLNSYTSLVLVLVIVAHTPVFLRLLRLTPFQFRYQGLFLKRHWILTRWYLWLESKCAENLELSLLPLQSLSFPDLNPSVLKLVSTSWTWFGGWLLLPWWHRVYCGLLLHPVSFISFPTLTHND